MLDILRLTPATAQLPILMCSADTQLLQEKAYELALGNCEVVEKPFDVDAFVDNCRAMLVWLWQPPALQTYRAHIATMTLPASKRLSQHECSSADATSAVQGDS